ncbi:MAG TPA: hypothetical protein PLC99_00490 [Verrucomicrobiota bacterium]|nr:hypothetical protein [Verrucomicrobiota bacterium]
MSRGFLVCMAMGLILAACGNRSRAEMILVPNASFESPDAPYVSVNVDSWQKVPKPDWYVESGGFLWDYNVGLFENPLTNTSGHIDNCDGNQAVWLFVVPEVALFQDYDSTDWRSPAPTHEFDATFEAGRSYQLTVGVIGTGGGMQQGAALELSLYYRDDNSNRVTVAAVSLTNTTAVFSNNTHLLDFHVNVSAVRPGDAWAGRHIGIQMLSTVDPALEGGYWDLDNVRLSSTLEPILLDPVWTNSQFQFTLRSEPGLAIEILSATNPILPLSNWTSLGSLTNISGMTPFADSVASGARRYYCARRLP